MIGFSLPARFGMYRKISALMNRATTVASAHPTKPRIIEPARSMAFENEQTGASSPLAQKAFRQMLCQERKRSERSRRTFVLMLVRAKAGDEGKGDSLPALPRAARVLSNMIRETDALGWFEAQSIGVIFTELGSTEIQACVRSIEAKTLAAFQRAFGADHVESFEISFHTFPHDPGHGEDGRDFNAVLYPDLSEKEQKRRAFLVVKRVMDVIGSSMALLVLAPVFFELAILIKLTSKGPVFFRQERLGQFEKPFVFLKFRSMHVSTGPEIHKEYVTNFIAGRAESNAGDGRKPIYKIMNDPRVTWIGRFMRRTSLDELPQFWNVLRGQMSLVGPRPPIQYEIEAYDLWHRRRLLEAKPGITGLWQVHGRSKTTFDDMVRLDLRYCRTWSPLSDLKILIQTPRAVFSGEGAY